MQPERELVEIEAIKQLKARYFRLMDTKQWDAFRQVFTDDAVLDVRAETGTESGLLRGGDAIAAGIRQSIEAAVTVHHGHMPEIRLLDAERAEGIWAMEDVVEWPSPEGAPRSGFRGYGHYHETYRKVEGSWRIATLELTRLRRDPL